MKSDFKAIAGFTKVEVLSFVRMKLLTVDAWAKSAVVRLYTRQTDWEKRTHSTRKRNAVGFSKFDAPFLTSMAIHLKTGQRLSAPELNRLRKMMGKYAVQLLNASFEKDRYANLTKHLHSYYKREAKPEVLGVPCKPIQLELSLEQKTLEKAAV